MQLTDVNYNESSITINKTITRGLNNTQKIGKTKTVNSNRTLYVDKATMDMLHDWQNLLQKQLIMRGIGMQNDQLLFPNSHNSMTSLMEPNHWLKRIVDDNNLKPAITPHGFRSTMASLLSQAQLPMKSIQLILGDNSTDVLLTHYIQQDEKMKQESSKQFSDYIGL